MAGPVGQKGLNSNINVTPLVDVILVLLIIFMVVVPNLQRGEEVELPKAKNVSKRKTEDPDPILLAMRKDGSLVLQKKKVTLEKLPFAVREFLKTPEGSGRPILVKADARLQFGKVRRVLTKLQAAGLAGAGLAAVAEKEGKE